MLVTSAIKNRISTSHFDPNATISQQQIRTLIELATQAPSAYNLQNWRFIAVHSNAEKLKLAQAAYNQTQIIDASVTFVMCGTLNAHHRLAETLKPCVQQSIMNPKTISTWVSMAMDNLEENPQNKRDEAIRSVSLAGMTLMLAAQEMGFATGPIGGFDPQAVSHQFQLDENTLPVLLITVGKANDNNWPRKPRKAIEDVLSII